MNEHAQLYDTETVSWGKKGKERSLTVRGLSTQDLTVVIKTHKAMLDKLFDSLQSKPNDDAALLEFGMEILTDFPELVATLVALASDQPDRSGQIMLLPAPTQLALMEAIYTLTVTDTGGLNDFLARVFTIVKIVRAKTESLPKMNTGT